MNNINIFEDFEEKSYSLLNQLIKNLPIGSLIINEVRQVIYMNDKLLSYFDYNIDLAYEHFRNMFRDKTLENENTFFVMNNGCCTKSEFLNSINDVYKEKKIIKNIQIKSIFSNCNKFTTKRFDISLIPFDCKQDQYILVTMMDITDLIKFKLDEDKFYILNDEDNAIEKNRFHENVMQCISENCHSDGQVFFILTKFKNLNYIQEKNEFLFSFYKYLLSILGPKDYACRYSYNEFLIFLPCLKLKDIERFMKCLNQYKNEIFHVKEEFSHKIMKMKVNKEIVKTLIEEDQLYIKYFKALSMIENFDGEDVCEIFFR